MEKAGNIFGYTLCTPEGERIPKQAKEKKRLGAGFWGTAHLVENLETGEPYVIKMATATSGLGSHIKETVRDAHWLLRRGELFPPKTRESSIKAACLANQIFYDVTTVELPNHQPANPETFGYAWFGGDINSYGLVMEYIDGRGPRYPNPDIHLLRRSVYNVGVHILNYLGASFVDSPLPESPSPYERKLWADFKRQLTDLAPQIGFQLFSTQWYQGKGWEDAAWLSDVNALYDLNGNRLRQVDTNQAFPLSAANRLGFFAPPFWVLPEEQSIHMHRKLAAQAGDYWGKNPPFDKVFTGILRERIAGKRDEYIRILGHEGLKRLEDRITLYNEIKFADTAESYLSLRDSNINWWEKTEDVSPKFASRLRSSPFLYGGFLALNTADKSLHLGAKIVRDVSKESWRFLTSKDTYLAVPRSIRDGVKFVFNKEFREETTRKHMLDVARSELDQRKITDEEYQGLEGSLDASEALEYGKLWLTFAGIKPLEWSLGGVAGFNLARDWWWQQLTPESITSIGLAYGIPLLLREAVTIYTKLKNPRMRLGTVYISNFLPGGSFYGIPLQMIEKYPRWAAVYMHNRLETVVERLSPGYGERGGLLGYLASVALIDLPASLHYEVKNLLRIGRK